MQFIASEETTDCGYACLAMIANYHGHNIDLAALHKILPSSSRGTYARDIIELADKLSLSSRILELDIGSMEGLNVPCILHWDMDHYVVLHSISNGVYTIFDPAFGVRKIRARQLSKHFTGYAIEFHPLKDFTPLNRKNNIKIQDLWESSSGISNYFIKIAFILIVYQSLSVVMPLYTQLVIDQVITNKDFGLLNILLISFITLGLVSLILTILKSLITIHFSNTLSAQIAVNLKNHLLRLPLSYFSRHHIGDINSRFGSVDNIIDFISHHFLPMIMSALAAMTMTAVMLYYSQSLTFISLGFISFYIVIRLILFSKTKRATMDQLVAEAKASSTFMETLRGMQTVKLFGIENLRSITWCNQFIDALNLGIRLAYLNIVESDVKMFLFLVENLVILYVGAQLVIFDQFSLGMLIAFIAFKEQLKSNAIQFIDLIYKFKLLKVHLDRIGDIVTSEKEQHHSNQLHPIEENEILEIENLTYRHPGESAPLFTKVNLTIKPGSHIAILGNSGSGKTTLLKVLLGLLQPEAGFIKYGNKEANIIGLQRYRKLFSTIMQDDELFSGTLLENITLFDHYVDLDKLHRCAEQAAILNDINAMPLRFDTIIGDMGSTLSGGQKQRLLIARALYSESKIIIMDEATSALDHENETKINKVFKSLNITRIIVAHRKSTLAFADEFYLLRNQSLKKITRSDALSNNDPSIP